MERARYLARDRTIHVLDGPTCMKRLLLLPAIALATFLPAQQNVLLVVADDLGLDPVPGYLSGPQKATMPTLASLMDDGLTFDQAWASPVCSPTRATIMTGRTGNETGVLGVDTLNTLLPSETTLFEFLDQQGSGHAMSLIGKWHLGGTQPALDDPAQQGVPQFTGILGGGVQNYFSWPQVTNGTLTPNTDYITEVLTDSAIAWINGQAQPWLCWLAYNAPHSPFHLPPAHLHTQGNLPTDSASIAADPLPYYLAMVESLDSELGRLLAAIPPAVLANTTIVFIGDNGTPGEVIQSPYQPNRAKGTFYQGGVHVPLVISGAGVTRQGEREPAPVVSTDLFATLVELTGEALPVYASSRSLVPLLTQGGLSHRDCLRVDAQSLQGVGSATREARYKLITLGNGNERFHDLQDDPYEATNLLFGGLTAQEQDAYDVLSEGCASITGIVDRDADEQVSIYPNPTAGTLLLEGLPERQTIHVMDLLGQVVLSANVGSGTGRVDLGHLAPGTYVLHGNGFSRRVVVQR